MRQLSIMVLVGLVGGSMLPGCSAAEPPPAVATATPTPGSPGPRVVESVQVQDHVVDLTIDSAAIGREIKVRLLLPADFAEQRTRHWPVPLSAARLLRHLRCLDPVDRRRAAQPAVADDRRDAGGW
jgi:hypothetical protein